MSSLLGGEGWKIGLKWWQMGPQAYCWSSRTHQKYGINECFGALSFSKIISKLRCRENYCQLSCGIGQIAFLQDELSQNLKLPFMVPSPQSYVISTRLCPYNSRPVKISICDAIGWKRVDDRKIVLLPYAYTLVIWKEFRWSRLYWR